MTQRSLTALLVGSLTWLAAAGAHAQIDHPRGHAHYTTELEPHLVVQWADQPVAASDGIGVGLRASIPVLQDGPVTTIDNSLAISLGLDWAHFGNSCAYYYGYNGPLRLPQGDCSANDFWLPVTVQWNFFFSQLISAFPELGLGIHHWTWSVNALCANGNACRYTGSDTGVDLALWLGVRFHLSKSFGLTLRVGTPSLNLGASFFL
jgi:hypothetical protein